MSDAPLVTPIFAALPNCRPGGLPLQPPRYATAQNLPGCVSIDWLIVVVTCSSCSSYSCSDGDSRRRRISAVFCWFSIGLITETFRVRLSQRWQSCNFVQANSASCPLLLSLRLPPPTSSSSSSSLLLLLLLLLMMMIMMMMVMMSWWHTVQLFCGSRRCK